MPPLQQFRVRDKLRQILKMVGATEKLFTTKQIISYLGKYIEQRKLYDSVNMRIVRCSGDPLEDLFGVQVFTIAHFKDIWQLVFPHLIPATNKEVEENESYHKVNQEHSFNLNDSGTGKLDHEWMSQLPWWYFVEKDEKNVANPDSKTETDSLEAGIKIMLDIQYFAYFIIIQATSTAYVVDTEYESDSESDGSKLTYVGDEDQFSEEYEPDSDDSGSNITDPLDSDDEHYPLLPRYMEDNNEETTTTDTTDVSMDCDMPLEDHWECAECTTMNPPIVRYCQRCWKLRKGWLPETSLFSPSMIKSLTLPAGDFSHSCAPPLFRSSSLPDPIDRGLDVIDGRTGSGSSTGSDVKSCNFSSLPFNNEGRNLIKRKKDHTSSDYNSSPACKIRNTNGQPDANINQCTSENMKIFPNKTYSDSTVQENSSGSTSTERLQLNVAVPGLCNICHNNPNDATIIHGRFGHQYCCYRCAKKLKNKGKTCPVCRQPIALVVKNYICQM